VADRCEYNDLHMQPATPWHTLSIGDALATLKSRDEGLTAAEATQRLAEVGPNELRASERVSWWRILLAQFKNVLILILLAAETLNVVGAGG
jgi:Ca2+-transporting ATPase